MSVVQNSDLSVTSRDSSPPLFQLSSVALRPMTSHARIEGGALYSSEIADSRPTPQKNFLPQLLPKLKSGSKGSKKSDDGVDTDSDTYRQKMWAGQANILVTVRLRPLLSHDRDRVEIVKAVDNKEIIVLTRRLTVIDSAHSPIRRRQTIHQVRKPRFAPNAVHSSSNQHSGVRSREKRYAFDYVFSPQDGQEAVYQHTTKFLIHGVLNGFNATVFAYGCTGAGKTYTMLGTHEKPGIMAKTLEDLFRHIERAHADPASRVQYRVTVSFLEVYNENIRDLLAASGSCSSASSMPTAEFLDLREDPIRGPVVAGLSEVEAHNAKDVMKLLRKGNKYRSQEATAANAVSSRSHAVLQVQVEQQENADSEFGEPGSGGENDGVEVKFGKLSLVDLAGSERAAVTQNRGQRLLEGANINRSLLALGNCINALGEKAAGSFVPYRDSKLTRLLKDSLGGNCRTVMIANVSLAASSVEETLNTLKYANRAKNIKTTVRINTIESDLTITNQSSLVANLQEEIATLKKALLQQQNELSDIERIPKSNQRWVDSKNSSTDCNDDDNNNQDDDWKNAKLREARQYITETFEERRRLHHALLKLEHQVHLRVQELKDRRSPSKLTAEQHNGGSESAVTELEAKDFSECSPVKNSDNSDSPTAAETTSQASTIELESTKTESDSQLLALTRKRELVMQQLANNERAMNEFRRGIELSPVMERNALIREILLMEYRIGNLEIDKMQLQTLRELQMDIRHKISTRYGDNNDIHVEYVQQEQDLQPNVPATISEEQSQSPGPDSPRVRLPKVKGSRKGVSRGGFFEELREHLYPDKSNSHRDGRQQSGHVAPASPSVFYRNWGIHFNNAALPYIRLKKKNPVPLYVEPTMSVPTEGSGKLNSLALTKTSSATSLAEPYLKSLKNRRKHRGSSKRSTSSQKKK